MAAAGVSRRGVLGGAVAVGAGAWTLGGCGTDDDTGPAAGGATTGAVLAATADVPVTGGVVVQGQEVVVAQPTAGDYRAFSAVCTHNGCLVAQVSDNEITCPCHGSRFSAVDGSVISGLASAPLPEIPVVVEGGNVTRA